VSHAPFSTVARLLAAALLGALLLVLPGCSHAPFNEPLGPNAATVPRPLEPLRQAKGKDTSIALFFSGGGTRAAAFSYGVLRELHATRMPDGHSLLEDVDFINAISGGCFPAAYYCLHGEKTFTEFEPAFLKQDIEDMLLNRALIPFRNAALWSSFYGRSDMAADLYDKLLFKGATFADLGRQSGFRPPMLVINATNIRTSDCFTFTQDEFDLIGSDLSSYRLSRAIAASSAVPVLFTPIVLRNYAQPQPRPLRLALDEPGVGEGSFYATLRRLIARRKSMLLDAHEMPYLHLMDGGLSDNLGLTNILDVVSENGGWEGIVQQMKAAGRKHLVLIVANAATEVPMEWTYSPENPKSRHVLRSLINASMNKRNDQLLTLVQGSLDEWRAKTQGTPDAVTIDLITLDFFGIKDHATRIHFLSIPTRFQLPEKDVDALVELSGRLLREAPQFKRLIEGRSTATD